MKTKTKPMTSRRAEIARGLRKPAAQWARQPFKTWQKRNLSILARAAFDRLHKCDAIEKPAGLSVSAWFSEWKHAEQGEALGLGGPCSLNDCKQAHYRTLEVHFQSLAGRADARTFTRAMASEDVDEGRRQALHYLREELTRYGLAESYAATIARAQYKRRLEELTPQQVTNLLATVRRRGKRKAESAESAESAEGAQ